MSDKPYDRSGKWLLEHHGKELALLGGVTDVVSAKAVQSETVQPRKLPDGLLEVRRKGQAAPTLLLIEIGTYPEERVGQQMHDGMQMVRQARGVLPDALALILCPKGNLVVPEERVEASAMGLSRSSVRWTVREVWKFDAEEMLTTAGVGIVPLVPLMRFSGPPEPLFQRCRERIDKEGGAQREPLLAVTRVLSRLKFVEQGLLNLLMRREAMIESPEIKEIVEEAQAAQARKDIERVILTRFGKLSDDARARLQGVTAEKTLDDLHTYAILCPTQEAFVERLTKETTPPPKPVSSRRKRKS
jgi:hypothetical protein